MTATKPTSGVGRASLTPTGTQHPTAQQPCCGALAAAARAPPAPRAPAPRIPAPAPARSCRPATAGRGCSNAAAPRGRRPPRCARPLCGAGTGRGDGTDLPAPSQVRAARQQEEEEEKAGAGRCLRGEEEVCGGVWGVFPRRSSGAGSRSAPPGNPRRGCGVRRGGSAREGGSLRPLRSRGDPEVREESASEIFGAESAFS